MKFLHYDLGQLSKGQIVEVTLTRGANVRLLDSAGLSSYKRGAKHKYYGGLAKKSPIRLPVPQTGRWHVVVDMQGLVGSTNASVRILPSPLPLIQDRPLREVPSLIRNDILPPLNADQKTYDVFISHASEDKDSLVRPLASALINEGLTVWFDEFTLRIGDSLRQKIDKGVGTSKIGLVVLSPNFIRKGWTNYELDGIISRAVTGEQVLLPIWHGITKQEVLDYSPSLADKVARSTATHTVHEIAAEISELLSNA